MKVVGHDEIVQRLGKRVPRVSLFIGPKGVGKATTARWVVERLGVPWTDVLTVQRLDPAGMDVLERFSKRRGSTDKGQVAIIHLGLDAAEIRPRLMVTLEQASPTRYILIATNMPTAAISSRGEVYRFGLLSKADVKQVLVQNGAKPGDATVTAQYSAGSMDILWLAKQVTEVKPIVQQALRALHDRDEAALELIAPRWSETATQWLARWCSERYTGRWRWFNEEYTEIVRPATALRILLAISQDVRPALIIRSCLMTMIKERRT